MPRRIFIALVIIILTGLSLAAMAAVGTSAVPMQTVTPQVHKNGDEGYFSIKLPLPPDAPVGYLGLNVIVESGDCRLVTARMPYPEHAGEVDEDVQAPPAAAINPVSVPSPGATAAPVRFGWSSRPAPPTKRSSRC